MEGKQTVIREAADEHIIQGERIRWGKFTAPAIAGLKPEIRVEDVGGGWHSVRMAWDLSAPVAQDEVATVVELEAAPDFWWAPHLAPEDGWCIAQHVFRSPALIVGRGADLLALVPDLDLCGQSLDTPWYLDYDAPARRMWIGLSQTEVSVHVGYCRAPGMVLPEGRVAFGFYLATYRDESDVPNPWAPVARFLWERYGHPLYVQGQPNTVPMDTYVRHAYRWAFDNWQDAVWQEFCLDGKRGGGPAFIVNVTQSPNYPGEVDMREFLSIWNQAWFSTLRAMSGVARYARDTEDGDLRRRAALAKEFALAAPMKDGIFPSVYRAEMETVEAGGRKRQRTKGWQTGYWTNSDRVPRNHGISDHWYHILDASWTCLLMLRWHDEIECDPRLLDYACRYAEKLLTLQDAKGFFPAWLHPETLEPSPILARSPEASMSATFLLKLADMTGEAKFRAAALRTIEAVIDGPLPEGRWEDFETFWSCSQFGQEHLGRRFARNAMHKQCNFSMFWTAEALLAAWRVTGNDKYLRWGRRTLDELSMTQQVWQPPFIHVPALGGFGVMNFDGEWNDSRQSLFAELFMDYYRATGDPALFERGVAALKAAFVMMYCPENPEVKALWEKRWPFFGPQDYGFTMENYGHGGVTSPEGEGIGDFTIFTWGNGAAAEARNRIRDHYGDVYIDRKRNHAFGIDSVAVEMGEKGAVLKDNAGVPRNVRIFFEDGSHTELALDNTAAVSFGPDF